MRGWLIACAALLAAGCAKEPPPDPNKPESYAVRLAVTPAAGGAEQRIVLPAASLMALRNPTNSDLRLFDASGRSLPIALLWNNEAARDTAVSVAVTTIVGRTPLPAEGVVLTIGPDRIARAVSQSDGSVSEHPVAALVDTRKLEGPASALDLSIEIPAGHLVTLTASASRDLSTWDVLTEQTFLRSGGTAPVIPARVELGGIDLKGCYLRISWQGEQGVTVKSASVLVRSAQSPPPVIIPTQPLALSDPHALTIKLPRREPPAAIRVQLTGGEGVVPLRYSAALAPDEGWLPTGAAILRGETAANLPFARNPGRYVKIEADKRTLGFSAPPRIELVYEPRELLARFSGKPPYVLAAGNAAAPSVFLGATDIVAQADLAKLPQATVEERAVAPVSLTSVAEGGAVFNRRAALWLALLAGTAVLAFAVWRLMRSNQAPAS